MNIASLKNLHWKNLDWKELFRNKKVWILGAALLLLLSIGIFAASRTLSSTRGEASTAAAMQTTIVRQGDLVLFSSGAGKVIPAAEISFGFQESGVLSEILVNVGEKVQAGQVLARLQTDNSEESIAASIASADLAVLTAQENLDELYSSAEMVAARALQAVEEAQQAIEDLQDAGMIKAQAMQYVAEAQLELAEAQLAYNRTHRTASQANIDSAFAEMILAKGQYETALEKFERYADKPDDNLERAQAQSRLSSAKYSYDQAVANYNAATGTANEVEIAVAEANLAVAQARLAQTQREWERVKDGPTEGEIAVAKAQLVAAQAEWERVRDGPDPREIVMAKATLAGAQAQLDLAKELQSVIDLLAPMDGTVMSINASPGENLGAASFITLADLSQPLMEVYLDETDLDKVVVGFEAEVVFDAYPDETFTGHVTEVNPSLVTVSNVTAVRALVRLDGDSFAKPQTLMVGLNASVDIFGGRAENALVVPVEALREISPNEYAVFVMENGEPRLRHVTVGLMDFASAQILSGLELGETITTGVVATNQ